MDRQQVIDAVSKLDKQADYWKTRRDVKEDMFRRYAAKHGMNVERESVEIKTGIFITRYKDPGTRIQRKIWGREA